jgi:branched-subunit amino acid permease
MHLVWGIFLVSAVVFGLTLGADWLLVPIARGTVADDPQPLWSLETAFVLRAIKLMAAGVAIIALVLMVGAWAMLNRIPPDP